MSIGTKLNIARYAQNEITATFIILKFSLNCEIIIDMNTTVSRIMNSEVYTLKIVSPYCFMYMNILLSAVAISRSVKQEISPVKILRDFGFRFSAFNFVKDCKAIIIPRFITETTVSSKNPFLAYSE